MILKIHEQLLAESEHSNSDRKKPYSYKMMKDIPHK